VSTNRDSSVDAARENPLFSRTPAGAYDAFLPGARERARQRRAWTPQDGRMPALYLSHGAPPLLDHPEWLEDLLRWGQSLPVPRAILVVSGHWESAPLAISATAAGTPLYYDFGGFRPHYYTLRYDTPSAADLARQIRGVLPDGTDLHQFADRGLDHGAFIPLMAMYPLADVPVLQLSLPTLHPDQLLRIGQRIAPLRDDGVLIVGSGFMTHNLRPSAVTMPFTMAGPNRDFDMWASEALDRGDIDELANFAHAAPAAQFAHRTTDHFAPLFTTLGAAGGRREPITHVITGPFFSNSRRSIQIG
jgi:4,5-DOPA dioxygenase extradiol